MSPLRGEILAMQFGFMQVLQFCLSNITFDSDLLVTVNHLKVVRLILIGLIACTLIFLNYLRS